MSSGPLLGRLNVESVAAVGFLYADLAIEMIPVRLVRHDALRRL